MQFSQQDPRLNSLLRKYIKTKSQNIFFLKYALKLNKEISLSAQNRRLFFKTFSFPFPPIFFVKKLIIRVFLHLGN